ncbi:hypothetical protein A6R68_08682 [Neotoma lepida]|uniref:THUMP domain-containing protein n=1 Tax=Neotoma lepida TaxID=56216 RepID=A0A1A6G4A0_NEOLE|nr:hypothetical protein A6R68_08682 [Neotoma lepida]
MAAPAQQSPQPVGGKRKGKAQFLPAKRARRCDAGGPRQLEPGLQGILITCNMNERKCVEEAYSLLNEYGDDMYGPEKPTFLFFVTGIVGSLNSENKVDLTNPEYTVVVEIIKAVCCLSVVKDYVLFRKYNLQEVVKSAKDSQPHPKLGNGKEAKLEPDGKLNQSDPAEGKNDQQVAPESSEELGQRKPGSETQPGSEGEAKPELESQVSEGAKSNEKELS